MKPRETASPAEINEMLLANLDKARSAHEEGKPLFFAEGLPFYTCVGEDEWTKEYPNGRIDLVHIEFHPTAFEKKETLICKIK